MRAGSIARAILLTISVLALGDRAGASSWSDIRPALPGPPGAPARILTARDGRVVSAPESKARRSDIVIVQLRGLPLSRRGAAVSARAVLTDLDAQHQRVREAIGQLVGAGNARRSGGPDPVLHDYMRVLNGMAVALPGAARAALRRHADVLEIHDDIRVQANFEPGVTRVGAPVLWNAAQYRGAGAVIAVIDTGVDYRHPDLGGCLGSGCKVIGGHDFVDADDDPFDRNGHGTHVAAIAAGSGSLLGVAPDASILAYRVLDENGFGSGSDIVAALDEAVDPNGDGDFSDRADVVNFSLGGGGNEHDFVSQAVDGATAAGILVVAAAGNDGPFWFSVGSPGAAATALTVGATNNADGLASFSSRGPTQGLSIKPDVTAPGVEVCAARAAVLSGRTPCGDLDHVRLSGTSMATPHAAGAAALLRGLHPELTPLEVKSLLVQTSQPVTESVMAAGAGRIDVAAAARAHTTVVPSLLGFGLDDLGQPVWSDRLDVTVHNFGPAARTYTIASAPIAPGVTLAVEPSTFTLAPGASRTLDAQLAVDNRLGETPREEPYTLAGTLTVQSTGEALRVPVAFVRAPRLTLRFDVPPYDVIVHDRHQFVRRVFDGSQRVDILAPPGTYDAAALLPQSCATNDDCPGTGPCQTDIGWCREGHAIVVREGIELRTVRDESLARADSIHRVTFTPRDELGRTASWWSAVALTFDVPPEGGIAVNGLVPPAETSVVHVSSLSPRYGLAFLRLDNEPGLLRFLTAGAAGVSGNVDLGNTAADVAPVSVSYRPWPDDGAIECEDFAWYYEQVGAQASSPEPCASHTVFATPVPGRWFPYLLGRDAYAVGEFAVRHWGPRYRLGPERKVETFQFSFPEPVRQLPGLELPLNLGPPGWARRILTSGEQVTLAPAAGEAPPMFSNQGGESTHGVAFLQMELTAADRTWVETFPEGTGTGYFARTVATDAPAGPFHLKMTGPPYLVGGIGGRTRVDARWDTTRADGEPPVLGGVVILSLGVPTDTITVGAPAVVRAWPQDPELAAVTLRVTTTAGTRETPLVPVGDGAYEATVVDLCPTAGGATAVVAARDRSGNTVEQRFAPLVACMPRTCGDGRRDPDERCDDGNHVSGDGCTATCTSEERCGNGVLDFGEGCDAPGGDPVCCSPACEVAPMFTPCADDHLFCTGYETCNDEGLCEGSGDPCAGVTPPACSTMTCEETGCTPAAVPCFDGLTCRLDELDAGLHACAELVGHPGVQRILTRVRERVSEAVTAAGECDARSTRRFLRRAHRKLARARLAARTRSGCHDAARVLLRQLKKETRLLARSPDACMPAGLCAPAEQTRLAPR